MEFFSNLYSQTPIDRLEVPQDKLNIEAKWRSNPLAWKGQFSPQLVQVLLQAYATQHATILDPFLGSGTVLLEAGFTKHRAYGSEINPAAIVLSRTYTFINIPLPERNKYIDHLQHKIYSSLNSLPLFHHSQSHYVMHSEEIKAKLTDILLDIDEPLQQLVETLIVLLDFYKPGLSVDKVLSTWKGLSKLVLNLPYSQEPIEMFHADARHIPLPPNSIDLVITSPPYINVFNYHQQYRSSMESLNWDLLKVAKSEFGSNRKHRSNRFLTVVQFCLDMSQAFEELVRVCKSNARLIFVVGRESNVLGTRFFNGEIVTEIASKAIGLSLSLRQERVFRNRFGQHIFEDILHFSLSNLKLEGNTLERARCVAYEALTIAQNRAAMDAQKILQSAIESIGDVQPSPIFDSSTAIRVMAHRGQHA